MKKITSLVVVIMVIVFVFPVFIIAQEGNKTWTRTLKKTGEQEVTFPDKTTCVVEQATMMCKNCRNQKTELSVEFYEDFVKSAIGSNFTLTIHLEGRWVGERRIFVGVLDSYNFHETPFKFPDMEMWGDPDTQEKTGEADEEKVGRRRSSASESQCYWTKFNPYGQYYRFCPGEEGYIEYRESAQVWGNDLCFCRDEWQRIIPSVDFGNMDYYTDNSGRKIFRQCNY